MADDKRPARDRSRESTPATPETESGTTAERDFGKTDRYANTDEGRDFNFRAVGDGTEWDNGRGASIAHGTQAENDTRAADAETPGVPTRPAKDEK